LTKVSSGAENDRSGLVVVAKSEDKSTSVNKEHKRANSKKQKKALVSKKKYKPHIPSSKKESRRARHKKWTSPERAVEPCEACTSILVVGDSLAVGVGMTLESAFEGLCKVRVKAMGKVSSGLDSPAFYDWQLVLKKVLDTERFDLVVLMMGANDAHNCSGSQAWGQAYESKFSELLKIPAQKHILTLVMSLPPMREPHFSERVRVTNEAIRNASHLFPENCVYIDTFCPFLDTDGLYTEGICANGEWKKARAADGVHFTMEGYHFLSKMAANTALRNGICLKSNF